MALSIGDGCRTSTTAVSVICVANGDVWCATQFPRMPTWQIIEVHTRCHRTATTTMLAQRSPDCPNCKAIVTEEQHLRALRWSLRSRVCTEEELAEVEYLGLELFGYRHDPLRPDPKRESMLWERYHALLLHQFKISMAWEESALLRERMRART